MKRSDIIGSDNFSVVIGWRNCPVTSTLGFILFRSVTSVELTKMDMH